MSEKVVWQMLKTCVAPAGLPDSGGLASLPAIRLIVFPREHQCAPNRARLPGVAQRRKYGCKSIVLAAGVGLLIGFATRQLTHACDESAARVSGDWPSIRPAFWVVLSRHPSPLAYDGAVSRNCTIRARPCAEIWCRPKIGEL